MRKVIQESRSTGKPRRAPPGKWLPWVFSVVLALILWVTAIQERSFTVSMVLPVDPPHTPSDYMIMSDLSAESVRVDFSGNGVQVVMDQIFRQPSVLELGDIDPGVEDEFPRTMSYQLSRGNVSFSGSRSLALEPETFTPATVSLLIDRKMSRSVPVNVPSGSEVPGRFMWPVFSRHCVDVTGAATVLVNIDSIETEPVLAGENQDRVSILLPQGVSGSSPRTISAAYIAPIPVVFSASE